MTIAAVPAFVVFTVIAVIAPWMYEAVVLPETLPVILSGFVLLLCGLGFSVRARLELGGNWTARPAIREKQTLVRTGPYAYVRHPIYTGLLTAFLGSAILTGALVAFICLVVIALVLFIKIRMEENFLIEEFGEEYEQYRSETKALIPRLI